MLFCFKEIHYLSERSLIHKMNNDQHIGKTKIKYKTQNRNERRKYTKINKTLYKMREMYHTNFHLVNSTIYVQNARSK